MASEKTPCPVASRAAFLASRVKLVLTVRVHGTSEEVCELVLSPREFSTHSIGWNASESVMVPVPEGITLHGEGMAKAQLGLNVILANSKDVPATAPAAAGAA
jgi:hypothetical protein